MVINYWNSNLWEPQPSNFKACQNGWFISWVSPIKIHDLGDNKNPIFGNTHINSVVPSSCSGQEARILEEVNAQTAETKIKQTIAVYGWRFLVVSIMKNMRVCQMGSSSPIFGVKLEMFETTTYLEDHPI